MDNMQDDQNRQAKIEALRHLRDKGFYEPQTDNPEGLNLDEGQQPNAPAAQPQQMPIQPPPQQAAQGDPSQTMQQNPEALMNVLKRKREQELMNSLFPQNGQERQ